MAAGRYSVHVQKFVLERDVLLHHSSMFLKPLLFMPSEYGVVVPERAVVLHLGLPDLLFFHRQLWVGVIVRVADDSRFNACGLAIHRVSRACGKE